MNQTKQKDREIYEPPVVTDIAPVAVARVKGTSPDPVSDDDNNGDGF